MKVRSLICMCRVRQGKNALFVTSAFKKTTDHFDYKVMRTCQEALGFSAFPIGNNKLFDAQEATYSISDLKRWLTCLFLDQISLKKLSQTLKIAGIQKSLVSCSRSIIWLTRCTSWFILLGVRRVCWIKLQKNHKCSQRFTLSGSQNNRKALLLFGEIFIMRLWKMSLRLS